MLANDVKKEKRRRPSFFIVVKIGSIPHLQAIANIG
jgi:hypothetical protein